MTKIGSPSGTQWVLRRAGDEAVVVEVGGGLRSYRVAGQEIIDGYADHELCPSGAGQVLAPWPNRIRDGRYTFGGTDHQLPITEPEQGTASHGLVRWLPWQAVEVETDRVLLATVLPAQPGYPWTLALTTEWSLGEDGLRAEHTATNRSDQPCPFGLGTHPYLRIPGVPTDELVLSVPAASRLLLDSRLLPVGVERLAGGDHDFRTPRRIGATVLDTTFGDVAAGAGTVGISTVDGAEVAVWADAAFCWWQVFTADTLAGGRRRRSVAVEPMTCPPDAFNSGRDLVTLEPGQAWRGGWGIRAKLV
ncbi:MAG: aldose 1-epimerase family protein [Micromonosporaceae bacterium]|nr:aldose 1-epimerase family protein [Micromonosporaceae bacterium]